MPSSHAKESSVAACACTAVLGRQRQETLADYSPSQSVNDPILKNKADEAEEVLSGKVLAYHVQGPKSEPQYNKKIQIRWKVTEEGIQH